MVATVFQQFKDAILQLPRVMRLQAFFLQAENGLAVVFLGQNVHRRIPKSKAAAADRLQHMIALEGTDRHRGLGSVRKRLRFRGRLAQCTDGNPWHESAYAAVPGATSGALAIFIHMGDTRTIQYWVRRVSSLASRSTYYGALDLRRQAA